MYMYMYMCIMVFLLYQSDSRNYYDVLMRRVECYRRCYLSTDNDKVIMTVQANRDDIAERVCRILSNHYADHARLVYLCQPVNAKSNKQFLGTIITCMIACLYYVLNDSAVSSF